MLRYALVLLAFDLIQEGNVQNAIAQDNPVVRTFVREVIKKELSARDSKEKGWHQGNTYVWLDNPAANLAADVTSLSLDNGRLAIEGRAAAVIGFNHKVALPIGSKTVSGQTLVYLSFKASAQAAEQLTNAKVSIVRLEIHDLKLRGDAVRPFQGIVQDGVNLLLKNKKHDIEKRLEEALIKANGAGRWASAAPLQ